MSKHVYFVEAGNGGPIKIGVASNVEARIRELQVGNAARLRLIVSIPGNHKDESRLHRRFKDECEGGEWFKANGAVRDFVTALVAMSPEDRNIAIEFEPPKKAKRKYRERKPGSILRHYTPAQLHAMFRVGDSGDVYRSREAEELYAEECKRRAEWGLSPNSAP